MSPFLCFLSKLLLVLTTCKIINNKAPRRKQRGIKSALQTAGFQPAFAPRSKELNPEEIKISDELIYKGYYKKLLENYRSFN